MICKKKIIKYSVQQLENKNLVDKKRKRKRKEKKEVVQGMITISWIAPEMKWQVKSDVSFIFTHAKKGHPCFFPRDLIM